MSFVGAGIGFRGIWREALLALPAQQRPGVLEVFPEHFFGRPELIDALGESAALIFHDVGMSLGMAPRGTDDHGARRLDRIAGLVERCPPLLFSEHLAITRSPGGIDLGHLAPIWFTEPSLRVVISRVRWIQERLGVPVAVENIAAPLEIPHATMSEAGFLRRLVEATGCGLLLDLTNLLYNGRNQGFDPCERLQDYPLQSVWSVHLAGGFEERGWWVDGHSHPVETDSYDLLRALRFSAPHLRTIIVERDSNLPSLDVLLAEAGRAEQIWRGDEHRG